MAKNGNQIESRLWDAADELRANSKLKASEYSVPVLGLIFLRYADDKFARAEAELAGQASERRHVGPVDYHARGVMYMPPQARFARLLQLPEGENVGKAINEAMKAIEADNPDLRDVLPKTYQRLDNAALVELLRLMHFIPMDIEGDAFGKIYEYFLGKFAMKEGQKGGEFFTPICIVKLIVEIIKPFHGRILDPANGSGGMFVQSARFVQSHKRDPNSEISVYGQERVAETIRLCKMNLAVHGLAGDIRQGNTYYEDLHSAVGRFDFVMANPPFNVDRVDKQKIKDDTQRFPLGMPTVDNANYLWIQLFYSSLNAGGRAGFVMANSAADARGSELEIRKKLIQSGAVDIMVSIGPGRSPPLDGGGRLSGANARPPCLAQGERQGTMLPLPGLGVRTPDTVLFIDARSTYHQVDRAHRDFTPQQIGFLSNIVRLYRGEPVENEQGCAELMQQHFPDDRYADVPGLCKVATQAEIEAQGWSLNPGRYVGVAERQEDDGDFYARLRELNQALETLSAEAHELEQRISHNAAQLLSDQ